MEWLASSMIRTPCARERSAMRAMSGDCPHMMHGDDDLGQASPRGAFELGLQ